MSSPSGRYIIVFNGEIYNFRELRKQLEPRLVAPWRGHSDTEMLLTAFEIWGIEESLRRFVGMFALALWDSEEGKLHLIRDRFGKKPLYYAEVDGLLWFGSDLQAWHHRLRGTSGVNRQALAAYMRLGCVPGTNCIYLNAAKVPAGGWLCFQVNTREERSYWNTSRIAHQQPRMRLSAEQILSDIEDLLRDAVRLRLESDVPLGAFLSGGIDSSLVVALMQQMCSQPVKTFSIGFAEAVYDEAPYARAVARHLGTQHTELYVSAQDALSVVPRLAAMYSEPFGDSSQIPTYLVSKLARDSVTVALSGDGGDELFAGYSRYQAALAGWGRLRRYPTWLRSSVSRLTECIPDVLWRKILLGAQPYLPAQLQQFKLYNKLARVKRLLACDSRRTFYLQLISQWDRPDAVVQCDGEAYHHYLSDEMDEQFPDFLDWMAATDAGVYLTDDILVKVDRASMAVSLEARCPLLDHRLYELAWSLPNEWKIRAGVGKWPLRQILYRHVPRELVDRPKSGFGVPIDDWLRGPLRGWADDLLAPSLLRRQGFLDADIVDRTWQDHKSGRATEHLRLWNILMFQAWLERYGA